MPCICFPTGFGWSKQSHICFLRGLQSHICLLYCAAAVHCCKTATAFATLPLARAIELLGEGDRQAVCYGYVHCTYLSLLYRISLYLYTFVVF